MTDICEALLIKKSPIGNSDIAATLFTKQLGKIRAFAKNAAVSRKRFGGRLELFSLIRIETGVSHSGRRMLEDAEVVSVFGNIANNMDVFLQATCVLEFTDATVSEEETPCESVFNGAVKALKSMDAGTGTEALFRFQTAALETLGFGVDLSRCGECGKENPEAGKLVFSSGLFVCENCAGKDDGPSRTVVAGNSGAIENVNCLNAFVQYYTGKVLKSAKLLENML